MLVIPVEGDKIRTKDDGNYYRISSFSSLKDEPAVYIKPAGNTPYIYFSDIVEINGVRVEYSTDSKVFDALGPLRRKYNLPQPKDKIKVKVIDVPYKDETEEYVVTGLRLHSKKYGEGRGLLVICKEGQFTLSDLISIERSTWTEKFDRDKFSKYYFDYLPTGMRRKGSS
jgi:hypothetical protein